MSPFFVLVAVSLGTYRITRLIVKDEFPPSMWLRRKVADRWGDDSWQSYLSECPWCASMYIGGLVVLVMDLFSSVPAPVLIWWAASAITGLIAQRELD